MDEGRGFSNGEATQAWDGAAEAWEDFVESGLDWYRHLVHGPGLLEACEPVRGLDVLDLGCGQGWFSRQLAARGARVVGVDLAEKLLALAREHEAREPLGIEYYVMPASEVAARLGPGRFDVVAACMSVHDMAEPLAALQSAWTVLRPWGRLVFSIPHPGTDTPVRRWERADPVDHGALTVDRYFDSGPAVCHWRMDRLKSHWDTPYWRHTLTEWTGLTASAGFLIRRLTEPRPTAEQVGSHPRLEDSARLPMFLVFDLVKAAEHVQR